MGLGRDGAAVTSDHKRIFRLVGIVGRLWSALDLYREAVERFEINGPWECSVALLGTSGSMLGNFATGWAEYPDPDANPLSCPEAKSVEALGDRRVPITRRNQESGVCCRNLD